MCTYMDYLRNSRDNLELSELMRAMRMNFSSIVCVLKRILKYIRKLLSIFRLLHIYELLLAHLNIEHSILFPFSSHIALLLHHLQKTYRSRHAIFYRYPSYQQPHLLQMYGNLHYRLPNAL